jgi:sugar phosphate isomerase/epimerase
MNDTPRRDFLKWAAASPFVAALASRVGFANDKESLPASRMQLGLVTYNWGRSWDLPTVIRNCAESGFGGVELRSTHKHGVEITLGKPARQEVARRFADSPVEIVGLGSACEYHSPDKAVLKKNIDETKAFITLCHDIGGTGVKVRPNGLPKDVPVEKTLEQIGQSLNEVAEFGAGYGVQIRLEVHGRGTAHVPHIKTIMDVATNKNTVVCWNCNPQDLEGEGLAANFNSVKDRVGTIHIHDLRNDNYPWPELFKLLRQAKFSGWTLLEDGRVPADIVGAMKENRKVWDKLAGA